MGYSRHGVASKVIHSIDECGAPLTYAAGVSVTFFTPAYTATPHPTFSQKLSDDIGMGWNYMDVAYAAIAAIHLLNDLENHDQAQNQLVALFNLTSFAQLLICTALSSFGPVSFAGSMALDALGLCVTLNTTAKRYLFDGWLDESLRQLKHYDWLLTQRHRYPEKKSFVTYVEDNHIQEKRDALHADITARCRVVCHTENPLLNSLNKARIQETIQQIYFPEANPLNNENMAFADKLFNLDEITDTDRQHDAYLQRQAHHDLIVNGCDLAVKIFSVVGMTLIGASVFHPPLFLPGLLIVSAVGAYNLLRTSDKIVKKFDPDYWHHEATPMRAAC